MNQSQVINNLVENGFWLSEFNDEIHHDFSLKRSYPDYINAIVFFRHRKRNNLNTIEIEFKQAMFDSQYRPIIKGILILLKKRSQNE